MKRSLVALAGLASVMMVGCKLNSESSFEANMEYVYTPSVSLLDTTYIDEDIKDAKYSIDTLLFSALYDEEIAGSAYFQAAGENVYEVDSLLSKQATAVYNKLKEDISAFDYETFLNNNVDFFKGPVQVAYIVQCTSSDKPLINDTLNVFTITGIE